MQLVGVIISMLLLYLLARAYMNHKSRIKEVKNVSIEHFDFEYTLETETCTVMSSIKGVCFDVRGFNAQLWDGFGEYRQGISLFDKDNCINFFFRNSKVDKCMTAKEAVEFLEVKNLIIT